MLSLRLDGSRSFEIGCCRQDGFLILLRWMCLWLVFVHSLKKILTKLKHKQTIYFTWINFLLQKIISCQMFLCSIWINLLLIKHKLIRHDNWSLRNCNRARTHNHLVCKRTLNHLAKSWNFRLRTKWLWVRALLQSLRLNC